MPHPAGMIGIFVTDHQVVQMAHANGAQIRHDHLRASAAARGVSRARIVEQGMRMGLHEYCRALPHVEHHGAEFAALHRHAAREQHGQDQQHAVHAHAQPECSRREQDKRAQQRQRGLRHAGLRRLPHGPFGRCEPAQHDYQPRQR
ncbi:hypothetical protein AWV80_10085 [Cupriavidus sp. UYMU48A]|nr:hypothetical protein AWV80_10085 [Cupriavidus sp. UYMU48A]